MNQLGAMIETLDQAKSCDYDLTSFDEIGVDWAHLKSMLDRVKLETYAYSDAKLGRWLGYIQGVLVANGCLTLEECKQINKAFADGT